MRSAGWLLLLGAGTRALPKSGQTEQHSHTEREIIIFFVATVSTDCQKMEIAAVPGSN